MNSTNMTPTNMTPAKQWIKSRELGRHHSLDALRRTDIPNGYLLSLPLPTHRCGRPAYAFFASAVSRHPGQPLQQQVPDRWFAIDAITGHLLVYALTTVFPFGDTSTWNTVTIVPSPLQNEAYRLSEQTLDQMDRLSSDFFEGRMAEMQERRWMLELLQTLSANQLLPQYQALAPDFFQWLES
ncbi:hypothetical protein [Leptolyngbya sp. 7M]|uniref:hypothetical protein n=1 Tax=Leptolyngbya sp. 7M TaxID=2812896 RepID=UPI001B8CB75A|nr:hypothetical protein [Leptolyngbya sp. 7M]QYO63470.1 hypothetical protein JVX88_26780 [Leptolyngbya sp. 7M]